MLSIREQEVISIPAHMNRAYEEVMLNPVYWSDGGISQFPDFVYLFEELTMSVLEERTRLSDSEIDYELRELSKRRGFNVEEGFSTVDYGIQGEVEVFNSFLASGFTFTHKEQVLNSAIREVW